MNFFMMAAEPSYAFLWSHLKFIELSDQFPTKNEIKIGPMIYKNSQFQYEPFVIFTEKKTETLRSSSFELQVHAIRVCDVQM